MSHPGDPYAEDHNPFQAPGTPIETVGAGGTEAELIRREHLSHEADTR
jgi:hypothetical protein